MQREACMHTCTQQVTWELNRPVKRHWHILWRAGYSYMDWRTAFCSERRQIALCTSGAEDPAFEPTQFYHQQLNFNLSCYWGIAHAPLNSA